MKRTEDVGRVTGKIQMNLTWKDISAPGWVGQVKF